MQARGLFFVDHRRVELREVELPDPTADQVLVATEVSGISSGTELLAYRGELDPNLPLDETLGALAGTFRYPFQYGYSCVGRVERSQGQLTEGTRVFAFHPHQDRFVIGADEVIPIDEEPTRASLFPLVETALQVCLDAAPRLSEVVVVTGQGVLGMLTATLLQRAGARVIASEPRPINRKISNSLGIECVVPETLSDVVHELTGGRRADLLVEASGNPEALAESFALVADEGSVIVCSWYGNKPVSLDLGSRFHRGRLAIKSSQVSNLGGALSGRWDRRRRTEEAIRLLRELPIDLLTTHVFPFDRASEAFAALDRGDDGVVHICLRYL